MVTITLSRWLLIHNNDSSFLRLYRKQEIILSYFQSDFQQTSDNLMGAKEKPVMDYLFYPDIMWVLFPSVNSVCWNGPLLFILLKCFTVTPTLQSVPVVQPSQRGCVCRSTGMWLLSRTAPVWLTDGNVTSSVCSSCWYSGSVWNPLPWCICKLGVMCKRKSEHECCLRSLWLSSISDTPNQNWCFFLSMQLSSVSYTSLCILLCWDVLVILVQQILCSSCRLTLNMKAVAIIDVQHVTL